ncbi:MAG: prepilin-type N-terminal cleavage/methylation domain-containing protein [bacterium]
MKKSTRTQGFTFIELIIAIVIIGILSVMGIGSYTNSLKASRDARRIVDIDSIRSALEQYKSNDTNSSYPATLSALEEPTKYISLPVDPKTKSTDDYVYAPTCDAESGYCTQYTITATLEIPKNDSYVYKVDVFGKIKSTEKSNE